MTIKELPVGSVLYLGGSNDNLQTDSGMFRWVKIDDKNHFILSGTDTIIRRMFDYNEIHSPSRARRNHGNNYYPLSNIHQYLNSVEAEWYHPTHQFDECPYSRSEVGFLTHFAPEELAAMVTQTVPYKIPRGSIKEMGDKTIAVDAKVVLPSASMVCNGLEHVEDDFNEVAYREMRNARAIIMTRSGGDNPSRILAVSTTLMITDNCEANDWMAIMPIIQLDGETVVYESCDVASIVKIDSIEPDDLSILFI